MNFLKVLICSLGLFLFAQSGFSQSLEQMTPSQLLTDLQASISSLKETERILQQNAATASENQGTLERLREENQRLKQLTEQYDQDVASHNQQVGEYNNQCLGEKLPENRYNQCLRIKENLDRQKESLDQRAREIQEAHAVYNQEVEEFNRAESQRATAANQLLENYKRLDQRIRSIQIRLYELSTQQNIDGFAEKNRQCTKREDLEDVFACMAALWANPG